MTSTQLLIGGRWTAARSGDIEEVRSPYDGSVVGEVREIGIAAAGGDRPSGRAGRHRHHPEPGVAGGGGVLGRPAHRGRRDDRGEDGCALSWRAMKKIVTGGDIGSALMMHASLDQERIEAFVSKKIHAGAPLWGNYPPGEETIAEYKASLADDGQPA